MLAWAGPPRPARPQQRCAGGPAPRAGATRRLRRAGQPADRRRRRAALGSRDVCGTRGCVRGDVMTTSTRLAAGVLRTVRALSGSPPCSGDGGDGGSTTPDLEGRRREAAKEAARRHQRHRGRDLDLRRPPGQLPLRGGRRSWPTRRRSSQVSGSVSGFPVNDVPVISVDGTLWINHPLLGGWSDSSSRNLCAPRPGDPAPPTPASPTCSPPART